MASRDHKSQADKLEPGPRPEWLTELDFYRCQIKLSETDYVRLHVVDGELVDKIIRQVKELTGSYRSAIEAVAASEDTAARVAAIDEQLTDEARRKVWALVDEVLYVAVSEWKLTLPGDPVPTPSTVEDADKRLAMIKRVPLRLLRRIVEAIIWQVKN